MIEKLGKIKSAAFGFGGYQGVQIGFIFDLGGDDWGTTHMIECGWGHVSEEELRAPNSHHKWTHEERIARLGSGAWKAIQIMKDAKVSTLEHLVGTPVRVFFESEFGGNLGFEILKDVI